MNNKQRFVDNLHFEIDKKKCYNRMKNIYATLEKYDESITEAYDDDLTFEELSIYLKIKEMQYARKYEDTHPARHTITSVLREAQQIMNTKLQ